MRSSCWLLVAVALIFCELARGQDAKEDQPKKKGPLLKVENIQVGFLSYDGSGRPCYKPGLWTPVHVRIQAGEKAIPQGIMTLETIDNEDVGTISEYPIALDAKERRSFLAYAKPGNRGADFKITIKVDNNIFSSGMPGQRALELQEQLLLTLGTKSADLQKALEEMGPRNNQEGGRGTWPRVGVYETNAALLPDQWLGYQGVDLMVLSTDQREFLNSLLEQNDPGRLRAIAQWVRRGGHLVLSVNWRNQAEVSRLLQQPVWQPPLPVALPEDAGDVKNNAPTRLLEVEQWADARIKPFTGPKGKGVDIAQLRSPGASVADWEVLAETSKEEGQRPLITRMPYGLGSITFLAFSLDQPPFSLWEGRFDFWKALVSHMMVGSKQNQQQGGGVERNNLDLSADLYRDLDNFDVKVVPFGWVALFILLYILVVGPLDYFLLKYVFQRLEWTWITFPTVVLAVSVAAYFTAYAIKGKDLKINQIDIVDFDLRTQLDENHRPKKAYAYGQTFFTLLSPRIQNYTIGVQPNPLFWGQRPANLPLSADMISWLGPAAIDLPNGTGRPRGTQSYFRRPYHYAGDNAGLIGVPIPVWTTKAFTATWETALSQLPMNVDLFYHHQPATLRVSGKLQNNLPVDLEDVWLFYRDKTFKVADNLPAKNAVPLEFQLERSKNLTFEEWAKKQDQVDGLPRPASDRGAYNPTSHIKQVLFFAGIDITHNHRNQAMRPLDQSWRLQAESGKDLHDTNLREGILYARVRFRSGSGEAMAQDENQPLPTLIWLGNLPGRQSQRPELTGTLNQDTYVRVLVPIRPASGK